MNTCPKCTLRRETPLSEPCPLCGFTVPTLYTRAAAPRRPKPRPESRAQSQADRAARDARRSQNVGLKS